MRRYVVGAMAHIEGRVATGSVFLSLDPGHYLDIEEANAHARAANERHLRIWPDSNVHHAVFVLVEVPELAETDGPVAEEFIDHHCAALERVFAQRASLTEETL